MKKITMILLTMMVGHLSSNVNLFDRYQDLNERLPIVDQGGANTCYAHTLSFIYNFEAQYTEHQEALVPLDTFWAAYIHKKRFIHWSPRNFDFSLMSWAYGDVKRKGICPPSFFQSKIDELKLDTGYSNDQIFVLLRIYFKTKFFRGISTDEKYQRVVDMTFEYLKERTDYFDIKWQKDDVQKVLDSIRERSRFKRFYPFINRYVFQDCQSKSSRYPASLKLSSTGRGFQSNKRLLSRIKSKLEEGRPVGLGICSRPIYSRRTYKDVKIKPRILKAVKQKRCGAHYVSTVGYRSNRLNQDELLIRNSYKGAWARNNQECLCENQNGQRVSCFRPEIILDKNLEVLGCWLNAQSVLTNTYDVSFY